jgi:UDP-glucuronate decarboxylase
LAEKTKKVLLTGGYGFMGRAMAERFAKEGWEVYIIDDCYSKEMRKLEVPHKFYPYSVTDKRSEEIFRVHNIDVVIHNAERSTSFQDDDYLENNETNFLGLVNMLYLSTQYDVKKFFLISTGSLVEHGRVSASDIEKASVTNTYSMQKKINENYALYWKKIFSLDITVLRFSSIYGPGQLSDHGFVAQFMKKAIDNETFTFEGAATQSRDFLYIDDAVFAVYRAAERLYQGDQLNISSNQAVTFEEFVDICKTFLPNVKVRYDMEKKGDFQRAILDNSLCKKELGWDVKMSLAEGLKHLHTWYLDWYKDAQKNKEQETRLKKRRAMQEAIKPYLENLLFFFFMVLIMLNQRGSVVNMDIGLDFNYVYIAIMGLLYGKKQSLPAMLLSTCLLVYVLLHSGADWVALFYMPQHLLHFASYLFVGVLTGYITDNKNHQIEDEIYQKDRTMERYHFLENVYLENVEVKNKLYHQIVNSGDSVGWIYRVIKKLDSVELENIFTQAAAVTAEIMKTENVVLYIVGADGRYLRQKVRRGEGMEQVPRSLKINNTPYLETIFAKKTIFINRDLEPGLPDLVAPIVYDGKVIAVIELFDMDFEQWSLYQQNMLAVTARLISTALGKAYQYEASIQGRKYIGTTRIMCEPEFEKICQEIEQRYHLQPADLGKMLLRVKKEKWDYEVLDDKLSSAIRAEDFIGVRSGSVHILLIDTNEDIMQMVRKRLSEQGIETVNVGDE